MASNERSIFNLQLSDELLARDWTLSEDDTLFIKKYRRIFRQGMALQLCAIRVYGRFLNNWNDLSPQILNYINQQLELAPSLQTILPSRLATQVEQRQDILEYLGYSRLNEVTKQDLINWVSKQAIHNIEVKQLLNSAEEYLFKNKVIIPSRNELQRLVRSVAIEVAEQWFVNINALISPILQQKLDEILTNEEPDGQPTFFQFLKEYPGSSCIAELNKYLQRYEKLLQLPIDEVNLENMLPGFLDYLYDLGKHYSAWEVKRLTKEKRYPILLVFLKESKKILLDYLVALHDQYIGDMMRETRNLFEKKHKDHRKQHKKAVDDLMRTVDYLLAHEYNEPIYLKSIYQLTPEKILRSSCETIDRYQRLEERGYADILCYRYPSLRKYFADFIKLPFQAEQGSKQLMDAIGIVRNLDSGELKQLPQQLPLSFVDNALRHALKGADGKVQRNIWELGVAIAIKDKFRSGDLYLPQSKRHVSFWHLIYNDAEWEGARPTAYQSLGFSTDTKDAINQLVANYRTALKKAQINFANNDFAEIVNGKLKLKRDDKLERSKEIDRLQQTINSSLPKIRIEQLLMEVDQELKFTKHFIPLQKSKKHPEHFYKTLMAAIVSMATNLGVVTMANSTANITVDKLRYAIQALIREDTINNANADIVNSHHELPLSHLYGAGTMSSSDDQRFAIKASSLLASYYPRYFGYYEKAIGIYTHVSDQYSVFNTKAISCGLREALYVLDGLLENNTILKIREHTTDTGGYTEHIFALCYLLGYRFMPRIRDLKDQQLYAINKEDHYGEIQSLLKKGINLNLIEEQWDQFMRLAASLKERKAPANVVVQRLINGSPADKLSQALTHLGRLIKTQYIFEYITDPALRRRVQIQLNKGEYRHKLSRWIFFANQGEFQVGDYEEIMNKASCLSLVSNAILYWNTKRITKIVDQLRAQGENITDEMLARVSLLPFQHVIPNGTYFIDYKENSS
jgi:TnpA family transposase